jgi:hypothetical protein
MNTRSQIHFSNAVEEEKLKLLHLTVRAAFVSLVTRPAAVVAAIPSVL